MKQFQRKKMEVIRLLNELKEIKRKINKKKYQNTNKLLKFARDFKDKVYWTSISANINISMDIIEENSDLNWDSFGIACNPNLTIDFITANKNKFQTIWHWTEISRNKNIQMKDIENNLDLDWDWNSIAENKNLTIEFVKKYANRLNWAYVSSNKNMTLDIIRSNPDLPWDYSGNIIISIPNSISSNPNLTINFITARVASLKENSDKDWNWAFISANSNITMNDIEQNPNYVWNYNYISKNKNLTEDFIMKNLDEDWDWDFISINPNIRFDIIQRHIGWSWGWYFISMKEDITYDIIESNLDLPWNWMGLSANSNLTEEFIRKNISNLDLMEISSKLFIDKQELLRMEKEYDNLIKRLCKEFIYNISVKMHNPETKSFYYKKDMRNLLAPNILRLIEKIKSDYNIIFNSKIENYLFDEIFEIQIEKKFFDFKDEDIYKILLNIYGKYWNNLTNDEKNYLASILPKFFDK